MEDSAQTGSRNLHANGPRIRRAKLLIFGSPGMWRTPWFHRRRVSLFRMVDPTSGSPAGATITSASLFGVNDATSAEFMVLRLKGRTNFTRDSRGRDTHVNRDFEVEISYCDLRKMCRPIFTCLLRVVYRYNITSTENGFWWFWCLICWLSHEFYIFYLLHRSCLFQ